MAQGAQKTRDAVQILHEKFVKGKPRRLRRIQKEYEKAEIAQRIYELRTLRGLTQKQLAELVRTRQSVISRLENADYNRHSLRMLYKIAHVLHCRVKVDLVPIDTDYSLADHSNARDTSLA